MTAVGEHNNNKPTTTRESFAKQTEQRANRNKTSNSDALSPISCRAKNAIIV